jgi:hypothetical protein
MAVAAMLVIVIVIVIVAEIEQIEEIAQGRAVLRYVGIVLIGARIGKIIAAAPGERIQIPIALDEFQNRGMVGGV